MIHKHVLCFFWFTENFEHMKKTGDYYVIVVEDTNLSQIVATATLITEHKFIHACAKVKYTPQSIIFKYTTVLSPCNLLVGCLKG